MYQLIHRGYNVKDELVEKDNLAFAVAHTGYFVGLIFAIGGVMMGESYGLLLDLLFIFGYGLLSLILLNISILINDKVILRRFSVKKEIIESQNVGTGVIEGASAVATGLIIMGSVYGEGGGPLEPPLHIGPSVRYCLSQLPIYIIGSRLLIFMST